MSARILLVVLLVLNVGCLSAESQTAASSEKSTPLVKSSGVTLYFDSEVGLSLDQVISRAERSIFNATSRAPAVFVEYVPNLYTTGQFKLEDKYLSLQSFAAKMEAQQPEYLWEVASDSVLLVYPKKQSFLTTKLGPFSENVVSFCDLVKLLGTRALQLELSEHTLGCVLKGTPKYATDIQAGVLPTGWGLGQSKPAVTLKLTSESTRVADVVVEGLRVLGVRFGAAVVEVYPGIEPTWVLRL